MGLLFVESLKRLYQDGKIKKEKIIELHQDNKITEAEMNYILDSKN